MKKSQHFVSLLFLLLAPGLLRAETTRDVAHLILPTDFSQEICKVPIWEGKTVLWQGISDLRTDRAVGRQSSKKGENIVEIDAEPPLDRMLESALKDLFQTCGMKLVTSGPYDVSMAVQIKEFFVGTEKKFVTGKAQAKSQLRFTLKDRYGTAERWVEVGYELESKKIRQKNITQSEETLNNLLTLTLEQVTKVDDLRKLTVNSH